MIRERFLCVRTFYEESVLRDQISSYCNLSIRDHGEVSPLPLSPSMENELR